MKYILVDFDGTLVKSTPPGTWVKNGGLPGAPVPVMVDRVRYWLAKDQDVRIFTARAHESNPNLERDIGLVQSWCKEHLGAVLPIQNWKCFKAGQIWDDIAYSVEDSTGRLVRRLDFDVEES